MTTAKNIALRLAEEGNKARAHYQIWWALRNLALPKYLPTMNDHSYVDFFHASNSGHYTLFLLALSKIFDRDTRVAGISELKRALRAEGHAQVANKIARDLKPYAPYVRSILGIRNRSLVHNEHQISRNRVYQVNGITTNQMRDTMNAVCAAINEATEALGLGNMVFVSDRAERATLSMLETLDRGRA